MLNNYNFNLLNNKSRYDLRSLIKTTILDMQLGCSLESNLSTRSSREVGAMEEVVTVGLASGGGSVSFLWVAAVAALSF